ncbi:SbcC/MukB-like Walker B domain-containing protein [Sphingobacterium bambusae]|uniref:SbcC/MukB-like Walker B domain-containing protein n=1 Tax=Sphingobacterium bambusae TaxID=662858 RepID=A0ABW6BJD3_9SPHI|nr:SbcC/MukB-like Walker B domain-containing protein [Sphingobacterium bambusae]WPL49821.1 SbcC/MukB-like Walker B domain-containing protein [Sphingobacterium bambusae]
MLPLYLSIEGLYSYQKKQEIDFTKLTEAGLFGIFGKVGSGKSSIIEAISFALYGETERLNKQEKRTYNMLNLQSDNACIVFEFYNFEQRKFRFVAQWKRRKRFEETTPLERYAYEWKDDQWLPLTSADGADITRLTYPNFRRTIIIPQGQFKEFLELRGKDRSDMIKEIFNLNRFDLGPKVSHLQRQNNSKIELLKGALSGFESVSTEILQTKKEELAKAQVDLHTLKEETANLETELSRMAESKRLRAELHNKQQEVTSYRDEQPKILQQEQELNTFESTQQAFKEVLQHTQMLNKEKEQVTLKIQQLTTRKEETLSRLEEQESHWKKIEIDYQQIEKFRRECEDLKLLIYIVQQQEQKKTVSKRIEDGKPHLIKVQENERILLESIRENEEKLDTLKHKKVDTAILLALEGWYQTQDTLLGKIADIKQQVAVLEADIAVEAGRFTSKNLGIDTWEEQLRQLEVQYQRQLLDLQKEETQLQVQAKLSEFADNLSDGQPCPLCGSLEHPMHLESSDVSHWENELRLKKGDVNHNLLVLKENFQEFTHAGILFKEKKAQVQQLTTSLALLQSHYADHLLTFCWDDFSANDKEPFLSYKSKNQTAETAIKNAEAALKDRRQELSAAQIKVEKYKATLSGLEQELVVIDSLVQQTERQLQVLKPHEIAQQKESTLLSRKQQTENRITYLEDSYKSLTETIQRLKTEFAAINGERTAAKEQFHHLYQQLGTKQAEISALLKEFGYSDIIQVQQILQKQLNVPQIRSVIQDFNVNFQVALQQLAELTAKIANDDYQENLYQEKIELFRLKKEELELHIRIVGALERECSHLLVEFEKKERLLEEYEQISSRKSNLTMLENLFRGAGFVNYVSSIHLQRLCEIANLRFHRLTRNNLSLTINESNEFEVIDYLNNGFRRSVKTLSGGQSFQASLCLALALAESIQTLNKADKNFFFIDEGFGTQDAESMNTVFETLQYLHRENRIVGIISHVEELKERIPRAVNVVNDHDKGSQINYLN